MDTLRLQIIIGSTRPTRIGGTIAEWFADIARTHGGFDVEVLDLREWNLPMLSEPEHPRMQNYTQDLTRQWSTTIDRADAYVIVTPEYNYGYTAPVKNALDHLVWEWKDKPIGFVSYGGVAAGARAVQMLKQVVTTLRMTPVFEGVYIPFVANLVEDSHFRSNDIIDESATGLLDELMRVGTALRGLRNPA